MFSANDIHSLTDFQRNAKDFVKRLEDTQRPEILTINGKAKIVIQDAQAYEKMVALLHSIKQISKSVKDIEAGRTQPLDDAFSDIKQRLIDKYPDARI